MSDDPRERTRPCPECGHTNTLGAETCVNCGFPFAGSDVVPRGETFNDPDDMSFPAEPEWSSGERRVRRTGAAVRRDRALDADAPPMRDVAATLRPNAIRTTAPAPVRYAGFLRRAVAFLIDLAVLTIFTVPLTAAGLLAVRAGFVVADLPRQVAQDDAVSLLVSAGSALMFVVYFTVLHAGRGQTIGKALLGIGVRSLDLRSIGILRSLIRVGGYVASAAVFGIGFVMIALTPHKRGWHDYVAGTCVVRVTPTEA